jgi:hypothetical protein
MMFKGQLRVYREYVGDSLGCFDLDSCSSYDVRSRGARHTNTGKMRCSKIQTHCRKTLQCDKGRRPEEGKKRSVVRRAVRTDSRKEMLSTWSRIYTFVDVDYKKAGHLQSKNDIENGYRLLL